jgi:hypothetical protein
MSSNIISVPVQPFPIPHFVVDDVFDEPSLQSIDIFWPERSGFVETGIPGNAVFFLGEKLGELAAPARNFWSSFSHVVLLPLYRQTFERYAHIYERKYGSLLRNVEIHVRLMEAHPGFADHEVHTHHWHDPTWLFTNLVYIDAVASSVPGTTLFGTPDLSLTRDIPEIARIAACTLMWEDMPDVLPPVKTVQFKRNRMFSFLDSPISYHGVQAEQEDVVTDIRRRVLRCHAFAPDTLIPDLYGIPANQYRVYRRRVSKKPQVLGWLEHELKNLSATLGAESPELARAYTENITFRIDVPSQDAI